MSTTLREQIMAAGFSPQHSFVADTHSKIIYLKLKEDTEERITLTGSVSKPKIPLPSQNPTLKEVTGGVRFKLRNKS